MRRIDGEETAGWPRDDVVVAGAFSRRLDGFGVDPPSAVFELFVAEDAAGFFVIAIVVSRFVDQLKGDSISVRFGGLFGQFKQAGSMVCLDGVEFLKPCRGGAFHRSDGRLLLSRQEDVLAIELKVPIDAKSVRYLLFDSVFATPKGQFLNLCAKLSVE